MSKLTISLKNVTRFFVVQSDKSLPPVMHEKELSSIESARALLSQSQAPIKYLNFNYSGDTYSLYPIENSQDFKVVISPILN